MIQKRVNLWEDQKAYIETYILDGDKSRPGVLICPGGGYSCISQTESEVIAMQYTKEGFNAFILHYRLEFPPLPILDLAKAMCVIREDTNQYKTDKICLIGFSAGGHLAASLGVHYKKEFVCQKGICPQKARPDGMILCYPVISSTYKRHKGSFHNLCKGDPELLELMSLEKHVEPETPQCFMWHTFDDPVVDVDNSLMFAKALREQGVPFELHIYPHGKHGLSVATEQLWEKEIADPHVATWVPLSVQWLKRFIYV